MKPGLMYLAQAFVDAAETLSESDQKKLADAALEKMRLGRLGTPREFFRAVTIVLRRKYKLFKVEAATALTDKRMQSLTKAAESSSSSPVRTIHSENSALVGGVIAQVGDERFDASALGMLNRATEALLIPLR
jgi:F0F1-type ATP synthase delta subunit